MVLSGMIFQFNSEQGTGLLMLSNGESKEFSIRDWVDESQAPEVGLKISYEDSGYFKKIKLFSEEESIANDAKTNENNTNFKSIKDYENHYSAENYVTISSTDEKLSMQKYSTEGIHSILVKLNDGEAQVTEDLDPLVSVDDHIAYFKEIGFKLASDSVNGEVREASLRSYSMDDYGEVSIKYCDSKLNITVMINGKKVYS